MTVRDPCTPSYRRILPLPRLTIKATGIVRGHLGHHGDT
jgi:hypothetical protein